MTNASDQYHALSQLLNAIEELQPWDYYKKGGWAGDQLRTLLAQLKPVEPSITFDAQTWNDFSQEYPTYTMSVDMAFDTFDHIVRSINTVAKRYAETYATIGSRAFGDRKGMGNQYYLCTEDDQYVLRSNWSEGSRGHYDNYVDEVWLSDSELKSLIADPEGTLAKREAEYKLQIAQYEAKVKLDQERTAEQRRLDTEALERRELARLQAKFGK